jgi:signal transduction histidine kinase
MSNIEKYAQASQVSCEFLWEELALTLVITDNGRGFNPNTVQTSRHFGLKFMQDRTEFLRGNFIFRSAPGQGTTITVAVPYEYEAAAQVH